MALKVEAGKITEYIQALDKIITASDDTGNNIPFEMSYWSIRMHSKLKPEEEAFMKQRDKLLEKYGERVLDKNNRPTPQFTFPDADKAQEFQKALKELGDTEINIEGIYTKPMSAFGQDAKKIFTPLKTLLGNLIVDDYKEVITSENTENEKQTKEEGAK